MKLGFLKKLNTSETLSGPCGDYTARFLGKRASPYTTNKRITSTLNRSQKVSHSLNSACDGSCTNLIALLGKIEGGRSATCNLTRQSTAEEGGDEQQCVRLVKTASETVLTLPWAPSKQNCFQFY